MGRCLSLRAVVQRVTEASGSVEGEVVGSIGHGLVVLLGVSEEDGPDDVRYMVDKIPYLRIFDDDEGKLNLSLLDVGEACLPYPSSHCMETAGGDGVRVSQMQPALKMRIRSTRNS